MKKIWTILAISGVVLSACHKDYIKPASSVTTGGGGITLGTPPTVNDTTKGYLRVQLAMNATATDDILVEFNPAASAVFSGSRDARSFPGMGAVSLSSLSSDDVPCAINQLPLVSSGTDVGLVVNASASGKYKLNLTEVSSTVPSAVNIWLKDAVNKDSVNFRKSPSYAFNINKSDSTTYGSNRFTLVMSEN